MDSVYVTGIQPHGDVTSTRESLLEAFGRDVLYILYPIRCRGDLTACVVKFKSPKVASSACSTTIFINDALVQASLLPKTLYGWCTAEIDAEVLDILPNIPETLQRLSQQTGVETIFASGGKARLRGSLLQLHSAQAELEYVLLQLGQKSFLCGNQDYQEDVGNTNQGEEWEGGVLNDLDRTLNGNSTASTFYEDFGKTKVEKSGGLNQQAKVMGPSTSWTEEVEVEQTEVSNNIYQEPQHMPQAPAHQDTRPREHPEPHEKVMQPPVQQNKQRQYRRHQDQHKMDRVQTHRGRQRPQEQHKRDHASVQQEQHKRDHASVQQEQHKRDHASVQQEQHKRDHASVQQEQHKRDHASVQQEQHKRDQASVQQEPNQKPLDFGSFSEQFGKSGVEGSGKLNKNAKAFEPSTQMTEEEEPERLSQNGQSFHQTSPSLEMMSNSQNEAPKRSKKHATRPLYDPLQAVRPKEMTGPVLEAPPQDGSWKFQLDGLEIELCSGDITALPVDATVIPCDKSLRPPPSYRIFGRCGEDHHAARKDVMKNWGYLKEADVVSVPIGAREFPCEYFIYVMGPDFRSYQYEEECEGCMVEMFYNILHEANEGVLANSIATAPISTGQHKNVPVDMCARSFVAAVTNFIEENIERNLKKIWMVNMTAVDTDEFTIQMEQCLGLSAERSHGMQLPRCLDKRGRGGRGRGRGHRYQNQRTGYYNNEYTPNSYDENVA